MAPKNKTPEQIPSLSPRLGILEELQDQILKLDKKTTNRIEMQVDILEDIVQRMTVLESHAEKECAMLYEMEKRLQNRDEIIAMLRDHTLRLVKEKENLLMYLGMKRQSELNNTQEPNT